MRVKPRNTLVLVRLNPMPKTRKAGLLTVANDDTAYCTGTIVELPQGTIISHGGEVETHDLRIGQTVLVKYRAPGRGPNNTTIYRPTGLDLSPTLTGENNLVLFEQNEIIAILDGEIPTEFGGTEDQFIYDDIKDPPQAAPQLVQPAKNIIA